MGLGDCRRTSLGRDRVAAHGIYLGNHRNAKLWIGLAQFDRGPQPRPSAADDQNVVFVTLHLINLKSRNEIDRTVVTAPEAQSIGFSEDSRSLSRAVPAKFGPQRRPWLMCKTQWTRTRLASRPRAARCAPLGGLIYPPGTNPEKYYGDFPLFRAKLISCSWVILSLSAGGCMKGKWIARLAQVNKELLLIFSIVASAALVNFFVEGQRLVLTFYNLPTLFAVYYFGRRRAVQAAVATILFVTWVNVMHPTLFNRGPVPVEDLLGWSDLSIWAGFLVIFAYATGTLHQHSEERMRELRETYFGVLQILSQMISNDKFTQNHSYRVSIYATQIALELGMGDDQVEDVRAAALLHDVGKLEISREVLYKSARLTDARR